MANELSLNETFFALIRNAVLNTPLLEEIDLSLVPEIVKVAKHHDLSQLIAYSVIRNNLLENASPEYNALKQKQLVAISRVIQIEYEQSRIFQALEENKIPFVVLKGTVIRNLYAESWMRTSCDIDTLIHESDLEKATEVLKSTLNYKVEGNKNFHDISLFSPSGVHLELHFCILENNEKLDKELKNVWDYLIPLENYCYGYQETPEFFLFHHLAHMAYHLLSGGCGIRPFIDLWLIENQSDFDKSTVKKLLKNCGLEKFAESASALASYWMTGTDADELCLTLEKYVLTGGCYGTERNKIAVSQAVKGNRFLYILSRIFLPYRNMIILYPWLKKLPFLLPVAEILRWIKTLNTSKLKRIKTEIETNNSIKENEKQASSDLMSDLGLL